MIKSILIFIIFIFSSNLLFAEVLCTNNVGQLPSAIDTFLKEPEIVQKCNATIDDKNNLGPVISANEASEYCSCMTAKNLVLTKQAQEDIKPDIQERNLLGEMTKKLEQKEGAVLRNEILNTLKRLNNYDNLLKRGLINDSDISKIKNCSLSNLLPNKDSYNSQTCENFKGQDNDLFNSRLKAVFPEGIEPFKSKLSDVGNTLAKNVKGDGSCLTYQNYLEVSNPIHTNGNYLSLRQNVDWKNYRSSIEKNIVSYTGSHNENSMGKRSLDFIKGDPIFNMALHDEKFYATLSNFIKENSKLDPSLLTEKIASSDVILKELLNAEGRRCESDNGGMKANIKNFLCSPRLSPPSRFTLKEMIDETKKKPEVKARGLKIDFSDIIKKKAICDSNYKSMKEQNKNYSSVDEFTSPLSELDTVLDSDGKNNNFLKDYKTFSANYCKYLNEDCKDNQKAKKNNSCKFSTSRNMQVITNQSRNCLKMLGNENLNLDIFLTRVANPSDKLSDIFPPAMDHKFKNTECENWEENVTRLRHNTPSFIASRLSIKIPEEFKGDILAYINSEKGKGVLKKAFDDNKGNEANLRALRSLLKDDVNTKYNKNAKYTSLFGDYFANGTSEDVAKLKDFEKMGPTSIDEGNPSDAKIPYTRKAGSAGPKVSESETETGNGKKSSDSPGEVVTTLDDLLPKVIAGSEGNKSLPEASPVAQSDSSVGETKKKEKFNYNELAKNVAAGSGTGGNSKAVTTSSFTLTSSSSSSSSGKSNAIKEKRENSDYENKTRDLENQVSQLKNRANSLQGDIESSSNSSSSNSYNEEKDRLTKELNSLQNEKKSSSSNYSNNSGRSDYGSNNFNRGNNNYNNAIGNSNNSNSDSSAAPNNGYARGQEFEKERAKNKLDDGSAEFDPSKDKKDRAVASGGASGAKSAKAAKNGAPTLDGAAGGDGEDESNGGAAGNGKKKRKGGAAGGNSDVIQKCGADSEMRCIFPNSYFVDEEIKTRLYTTIHNLKLEGRKFQGLEKFKRSRRSLKAGESPKAQYYLYTYDLVIDDNGQKREVTNEEREKIYKEIKENRDDKRFKKKLLKYQQMTKQVGAKVLLGDADALNAIKKSITKDEYEDLQD